MGADCVAQVLVQLVLDGPELLQLHHGQTPLEGKSAFVFVSFRFDGFAPGHAMTDAAHGNQKVAAGCADWLASSTVRVQSSRQLHGWLD
jgi:hypothetical protein